MNEEILKRYYPDVIEGKFFLINNINSRNFETTKIHIYTYLYDLYLLKKNITSDNISYKDFVDNNVDYTEKNKLKFLKFDHILKVRYYFLKIFFPIIDYEAFLNNVEIYFLYYYERINISESIDCKLISRKLVVVALFYLKIKSDIRLYMQKKLPDKFFVIFYLIHMPKEIRNLIERLLNFFDEIYIFKLIICFIYKYLAEYNVENTEWFEKLKNTIQSFNENNNIFTTVLLRNIQSMGTSMLINHLAVPYD
ncbi:hypothetical protein GVAV_000429 [Gurleya vavrai]